MSEVIESLSAHRTTALIHRPPSYPSQYHYSWKHPLRQNAADAARKSLYAFQQMLAYCSYSAARVESPIRGQCEPFYQQPALAESIISSPLAEDESDPSILQKLLWATLGEIRQTRNFVGAAISYSQPFNYERLGEMVNYGVPVYVSWSSRHRTRSYSSQPLSDLLLQWLPPLEAFGSPDAPPDCLHGVESNSEDEALWNIAETPAPPADQRNPNGFRAEFDQLPAFGGGSNPEKFHAGQYEAASGLVDLWKDFRIFLCKRYGPSDYSKPGDPHLPDTWSRALGVKADIPSVGMISLYQSVVYSSAWSPLIDLPVRSTARALDVSIVPEGYLLSVNDGRSCDWRLLIEDPLTILQIQRESWDTSPDGLIFNLVKSGLPFQVLNIHVLEDSFYGHPSPTAHPPGSPPTYADYLFYRQDLVDFFARYPHTYTAALCAGGILWRIAMDIRPLPAERDIVRAFHSSACLFRAIGGQIYGTPKLTKVEEDVIVGVYSWTESKRV